MDERTLIQRIAEIIGPEYVGDDCAILPHGDECLVVSTDMLHERTDFPEGMTGRQIGWMAIAVTLSDIAAMGAMPVAVVLAVGLDDWHRLEEIIRGAHECCAFFGCELAGGDIDTHDELTLVSTGIGRVASAHLVRRRGARVGDLVCITGTPGCAQAGLEGYEEHREALLVPRPFVREGQILGRAGATAMMDVSDGLVLSLYDLLAVNTCGFAIRTDALPRPTGVAEEKAKDLALFGGGDFGLLFLVPPERYPVEGVHAAVIGEAIGERAVLVDGKIAKKRGFVHQWKNR